MNLPFRPAAVVFDMDGLLFDTERLHQEAILAAAADGGHDLPLPLFRRMLGGVWLQNRALLLDHFGEAFPVDELRAGWLRHFDRLVETRLALKPGAAELLDTLDAFGLPRAIATSSAHHSARHHLAAHDLTHRFDTIVASGDYAASKPAPDPYLKAAERLGIAPSLCLALEDSFNGIRSACSAGMVTVMVPDLLPPTDEIRSLCRCVAEDLHEVNRMVLATAGPLIQRPPG